MAKLPKDATKELGYIGTEIFTGYIDVDYQEAWRTLVTRIKTVEKMKWGSSTVASLLRAVKSPILSSTQLIEAYDNDEKYQEHADFVRKNLFDEMNFREFHVQMLSYLEYGFSVFEKVYKIKDGRIYIQKLAPRIQESIEKWSITGAEWIDGHPAGITQGYVFGDETKGKYVQKEIPWDKLLIFTNMQQGNNYEGESILRACYTPYFYLDLIQKVAGISVERYGVGLPYAKVKGGLGSKDHDKMEELLSNIRSNESSYALINENVTEFGILTPEGGAQNTLLEKLLLFYDKKIYDSMLAGFLNLTNGDGGSNALSKDQSSFFMTAVMAITQYNESKMNELIKDLIILNFGEQEGYPTFQYEDLGKISTDEYVGALSTAKNSGLINWGKNDEQVVRNQLGLAEMTSEQEEMYEIEDEGENNVKKGEKPEVEDEKTAQDSLGEDEDKKMSILSEIDLAKREKEFIKNISDYENYLESEYANILEKVSKYESNVQNKLVSIYNKVDTELKDGKEMISNSGKNTALKNEAITYVRNETKKLKEQLVGSAIETRLFDKSIMMAMKTVKTDRSFFSQKTVNSIKEGYRSNVLGILFNEPRRIEERIVLNFGSNVAKQEAITEALDTEMNRNILKLSTLTHPRQAFNSTVNEMALAEGFTFFKPVVPKNKLKDLSPSGMTTSLIYNIYTEAQLTEAVNSMGTKTNVSPLMGMNIHHGGYMYFLAIASVYLAQEQERARIQREELLAELEARQ